MIIAYSGDDIRTSGEVSNTRSGLFWERSLTEFILIAVEGFEMTNRVPVIPSDSGESFLPLTLGLHAQ